VKFCHKAHVTLTREKETLLVKVKFYSNTDGPRDHDIQRALAKAIARVELPA
jgi:hypothetical protein